MRTKLHALVNPADGGTGLNMLGDIPILRIVGEVAGEMAGYSPSRTSDKTHCLKIGLFENRRDDGVNQGPSNPARLQAW
jgi:hypothetical protein